MNKKNASPVLKIENSSLNELKKGFLISYIFGLIVSLISGISS